MKKMYLLPNTTILNRIFNSGKLDMYFNKNPKYTDVKAISKSILKMTLITFFRGIRDKNNLDNPTNLYVFSKTYKEIIYPFYRGYYKSKNLNFFNLFYDVAIAYSKKFQRANIYRPSLLDTDYYITSEEKQFNIMYETIKTLLTTSSYEKAIDFYLNKVSSLKKVNSIDLKNKRGFINDDALSVKNIKTIKRTSYVLIPAKNFDLINVRIKELTNKYEYFKRRLDNEDIHSKDIFIITNAIVSITSRINRLYDIQDNVVDEVIIRGRKYYRIEIVDYISNVGREYNTLTNLKKEDREFIFNDYKEIDISNEALTIYEKHLLPLMDYDAKTLKIYNKNHKKIQNILAIYAYLRVYDMQDFKSILKIFDKYKFNDLNKYNKLIKMYSNKKIVSILKDLIKGKIIALGNGASYHYFDKSKIKYDGLSDTEIDIIYKAMKSILKKEDNLEFSSFIYHMYKDLKAIKKFAWSNRHKLFDVNVYEGNHLNKNNVLAFYYMLLESKIFKEIKDYIRSYRVSYIHLFDGILIDSAFKFSKEFKGLIKSIEKKYKVKFKGIR